LMKIFLCIMKILIFVTELKKLGMTTIYDPNFYIIHLAQRAGRKVFSKSFFMNLKSMLTYFKKHPTFKLLSI
jgi:GT2 family glycosyltransferase